MGMSATYSGRGPEVLNVLVTVATVVSGDWVATVLVIVVVGAVLVDVIFHCGTNWCNKHRASAV